MINFKEILEITGTQRLGYTVTINGNPVWDYKTGGYETVLLIATIQDGIEEEYVTLAELRKYIVNCEIPFDITVLKDEESYNTIKSVKVDEELKEILFEL